MKLLTCIVTYNRLDYTKRCIESYLETRESERNYLVVVDNGSTDGTQEWLTKTNATHGQGRVNLKTNLYPAVACNKGWKFGLEATRCVWNGAWSPTHLHRSDNDIEYLPGWDTHAAEIFQAFPDLGELGLLNMDTEDAFEPVIEERDGVQINTAWPVIGGNAIIPRKLYDQGLRWEPGPWTKGLNEDAKFSHEVKQRGYRIANMVPKLAVNMAYGRYEDFPEYYNETAKVRGLVPEKSV